MQILKKLKQTLKVRYFNFSVSFKRVSFLSVPCNVVHTEDRVATNLENRENLENSGNLKNC